MNGMRFGLVLAFACVSAGAADLVVSGSVQSVTLTAFGIGSCQRAPVPDGKVLVSNACGCQDTKLKVEHVYQGAGVQPGQVVTLQSSLGEWCQSTLPLQETILVKAGDGRLNWSPLTEENGAALFSPARLVLGHGPAARDAQQLQPLADLPSLLVRQGNE